MEPKRTKVFIKGYEIKEKLGKEKVSRLVVDYDFISNDPLPRKYEDFLNDLDEFIRERNGRKEKEEVTAVTVTVSNTLIHTDLSDSSELVQKRLFDQQRSLIDSLKTQGY